MTDDHEAIRAELIRRGAWTPEHQRGYERNQFRSELMSRSTPPEPSPELQEIAQELGRRYKDTLEELDKKNAAATEAQNRLKALEEAAPDPGVLMALAVEALAASVDAMVRAMAKPAPTVRTVLRDKDGNISQIIDDPA